MQHFKISRLLPALHFDIKREISFKNIRHLHGLSERLGSVQLTDGLVGLVRAVVGDEGVPDNIIIYFYHYDHHHLDRPHPGSCRC